MGYYIDFKNKQILEIEGSNFQFPPTGAKMLLKARPPIAIEASTD
ncbi:MAG: hypothetical protein AABX38_07920 [Candidatus Micrarchaeota archaeon]